MHSISIRDIDSKLFNEVGKIFKVKVLRIHGCYQKRIDFSSFKFLENLTIDCYNLILIKNKEVSAIKHLILTEVNSI